MHQSVHDDVLSALKRVKITFVYNRREEDVEQEGRKHAALTKALLHSDPPRSQCHPVVEPYARSPGIIIIILELLTNDRDDLLPAKTGKIINSESINNSFIDCLIIDALEPCFLVIQTASLSLKEKKFQGFTWRRSRHLDGMVEKSLPQRSF